MVIGWSSAITITVFCLIWNPLLGLVLAMGIPVIALARICSLRLSDRADEQTAEHAAHLNRHLLEYTRNQAVLRAAGRTQDYQPLDEAISRHPRSQRRLLWMQILSQVMTGAVLQAVTAAAFATGIWALLDGSANAGVVVGVLAVAVRYYHAQNQRFPVDETAPQAARHAFVRTVSVNDIAWGGACYGRRCQSMVHPGLGNRPAVARLDSTALRNVLIRLPIVLAAAA